MIKPVNLRENVLKMFHRWHFTPVRLAKMSEGNKVTVMFVGSVKKNPGTYHMWWS